MNCVSLIQTEENMLTQKSTQMNEIKVSLELTLEMYSNLKNPSFTESKSQFGI